MRFVVACLALAMSACLASANEDADRLVDALGVPALLQAFTIEGERAGQSINDGFLDGQGGDVWAETVRRLYDPLRMEAEIRTVMADVLGADQAAQALLFFDSDLGRKVIELEVEARQAFIDAQVEAAAKLAPSAQSASVTDFLVARDLIERNTDVAVAARIAFFDGLVMASGRDGAPDVEALRPGIAQETESWLRGYYALVQSAMSADDIAVYTAFWKTEVGQAVDDALFAAFGQSYTTLSYALGQAAGRLVPQNEL